MARIIIRFTQPPYGSSDASDGLDFAIAATNYGHEVTALFENEGVWQLLSEQQALPGQKNIAKRVKSLTFFDIDDCFVPQTSLSRTGLSPSRLLPIARIISSEQYDELLSHADHVVTF